MRKMGRERQKLKGPWKRDRRRGRERDRQTDKARDIQKENEREKERKREIKKKRREGVVERTKLFKGYRCQGQTKINIIKIKVSSINTGKQRK